jgi:hypothetical protein
MGCVRLSFLPLLVALLPREAVRGVVTVLPLAIEILNRMNASYVNVNVEHPAYRNNRRPHDDLNLPGQQSLRPRTCYV